MRRWATGAWVLVACGACGRGGRAPDAPVTGAAPAARVEEVVVAKKEARGLVKKERAFSRTKLEEKDVGWDVLLRGALDPAFRKSIDAVVGGWRHARPTVGADGRFLVTGEATGKVWSFVLFDAAGAKVASLAGEDPFFLPNGEVMFHVGQQLMALGANGAAHAVGGPQAALCTDGSCALRTVPIAASPDMTKLLVGGYRRAFVSDDAAFVLDLATGVLSPLVARSKDVAWLSGTLLDDGSYCSFRTFVAHGPDDTAARPGSLVCFGPPWEKGRTLLQTDGGAWVTLAGLGPWLVTGDVRTLHVLDRKTDAHRAYPGPEGGGLPMPLADGRTVVLEGDGKLVVVDLADESYSTIVIEQTVVEALPGRATAFIATGDGTRTLVRAD